MTASSFDDAAESCWSDQWEYSHLTRAILSFIAVAFLAAAIAAT